MGEMSEDYVEENEFESSNEQVATKFSEQDNSDSDSSDIVLDAAANDKDEERRKIQADIEAFLGQGGTINQIDPNVMADPPKKPTSNYGGQPI